MTDTFRIANRLHDAGVVPGAELVFTKAEEGREVWHSGREILGSYVVREVTPRILDAFIDLDSSESPYGHTACAAGEQVLAALRRGSVKIIEKPIRTDSPPPDCGGREWAWPRRVCRYVTPQDD